MSGMLRSDHEQFEGMPLVPYEDRHGTAITQDLQDLGFNTVGWMDVYISTKS